MTGTRLTEINFLIPGAVLLLAIAAAVLIRVPVGSPPLQWIVVAVLGLLALILARTVIRVQPDRISTRFTLPWPQRTVDRAEVDSFRIVDIPLWVGWGFRWWFRRGWCWRAAGSRGVELKLRSGSKFVLGCKDPERVVAAMTQHPEWSALRSF